MKITSKILDKLNEKASIDWNNYLKPEEVNQFLSKDDKVESAEEIIYSDKFRDRFQDFKKSGWTKRELTQDLSEFYYKGHLNEDKEQISLSQAKQYIRRNRYKYDLDDAFESAVYQYYLNNDEILSLMKYVIKLDPSCESSIKHKIKRMNVEGYINVNLNEDAFELWKNQVTKNDYESRLNLLRKLYKEREEYNENTSDIKSTKYFDLIDKIDFLEASLGLQGKIGRELK